MPKSNLNKAKSLRELIKRPGIHVGPGVYDCLGAKIVEKLGFELVFTSGLVFRALPLGVRTTGT